MAVLLSPALGGSDKTKEGWQPGEGGVPPFHLSPTSWVSMPSSPLTAQSQMKTVPQQQSSAAVSPTHQANHGPSLLQNLQPTSTPFSGMRVR